MRIALDTNAYTNFMRGQDLEISAVRQAHTVFLPLIVIAELRAGFVCGTQSRENEQRMERFLNEPRVEIVKPDEETTHLYARLYRQLREQGTPIPVNDLWIASLVLQHDLILVTNDTHFKHLPQIPIYE